MYELGYPLAHFKSHHRDFLVGDPNLNLATGLLGGGDNPDFPPLVASTRSFHRHLHTTHRNDDGSSLFATNWEP